MVIANWTSAAREDLDAIYLYLARVSRRPQIAYKIDCEIRDLCDEYANLSSQGHELGTRCNDLDEDLRSVTHKRWVILFRRVPHTIEVLAVVDGSRSYERLFRERGDL